MSYDYKLLFGSILKAIADGSSIADRMLFVIDECERQHPHHDWKRFRSIPFSGESEHLTLWAKRLMGQAPQGSKGVWFGLFQAVHDGQSVADIYGAFSPVFDIESNLWAENAIPVDSGADMDSKVMAAIYKVAYEELGGLGNDAEYPLVLAYGAMAARKVLEMSGSSPSLKGAAVGYDSGDWIHLGEFLNYKFVASPKAGA